MDEEVAVLEVASASKGDEVDIEMVKIKEPGEGEGVAVSSAVNGAPPEEELPTKKKRKFWQKKDNEDGEEETKAPSASVFELFSFADIFDYIMMFFGIIAAILLGCSIPVAMLTLGNVINIFINQGATQLIVSNLTALNLSNFTESSTVYYTYPVDRPPILFGLNCTFLEPLVDQYTMFGENATCLSPSEFNMTMDTALNPTDIDFFSLPITSVNCSVINSFIALSYQGTANCATNDNFIMSIDTFCYIFIGLAVLLILLGFLAVGLFQVSAERQIYRMRKAYYKAVLRQDIGWFDVNASGEVASRLVDDMDKIQLGMGEKLVLGFQWLTTFLAGFVVGFISDFRLTFLLLGLTPFLAVGAALMTAVGARFTSKEQQKYATAGAVAEEVVSSVKTVMSFGGESKESARYDNLLDEARNFGIKKGFAIGGSLAYVFFFIFASYSVAFGFGAYLVSIGLVQGGNILTAFFSVFVGAFSIGQLAPSYETFAAALGSAGAIFEVIKRQPPIDSYDDEGEVIGDDEPVSIHFEDVSFNYPARPDVPVLKSFNVNVEVGQTVALVGHSGCGKSTIVSLIQRFYDIEHGQIRIGSHKVSDMNLKKLRNLIGVVSQEPVLFATTIADNIRYGRDDATQEDIEKAAKDANVHDFIISLPQGYQTLVGERGTQLSGGQKQRVAIARALIRNPKIMLLDEATSALDSESERIVQEALERASKGRTSIVIAHRLSTIQNADLIVCMDDGVIIETGTHAELLKRKEMYYDMVTAQTQGNVDDAFLSFEQNRGIEEDEEAKDKPAELPRDISKQFSRQYSKQYSKQYSRQSSDTNNKDMKKKKKSMADIDKEKQEKWDAELPEVPLYRILALNAREWWLIILGILAALLQGSIFPLFAIFFGNILSAFYQPRDQVLSAVTLPALLFLILAIVAAVIVFVKIVAFAISGEFLTARIRSLSFKAMLRQELGWYDDERNSTGALTTRLAEDAALVQGATGSRLAQLIETLFTMLLALGIALGHSWIMTFVILGFAPFLVIVGVIRALTFKQYLTRNKSSLSEAGKNVVDSLENIRTVTSLNLQVKFVSIYENELKKPYKGAIGFHWVEGISYGISQGMIFFGYAITFRFGAFLVTLPPDHILFTPFQNMFVVLFAIIFGAFAIGQASAFTPDYTKARVACKRIFALLDRTPVIDNYSTDGQKPEVVEGSISINKVDFNYPSRPDVAVLQDFSLDVKPGQTIALVGPSGCGKSTIVSLTERFYDPLNGSLQLDGVDLPDLNIRWLRQQIGLVSQEPILFNISISDNIKYGANDREVSDKEVIEAATAANIHEFIQSLPKGYGTNAGDKGTQLSGGQKQRIAIARALVRNPKIMLLDEATSALDSESERIVQEALDKAREGRTSIVIAHRLSTIYNADCIIVLNNGKVIETGTHSELLASGGLYALLHERQQLVGES